MDFRHIEAGNPWEIHWKSMGNPWEIPTAPAPESRGKGQAQGTGADHDKFAAGADLGAGVIH